MSEIKSIMFFPNGTVAVTDNEQQLPEFQGNWVLKFLNEIIESGGHVDKDTEILLPDSRKVIYMPEHKNYRFI